jgi:hypothetical protein
LQQLKTTVVSIVTTGKEARTMRTGHCRHDWTDRSSPLGEAFPAHAGEERSFRVCTLCLRIEELEPRQVAVEFTGPRLVEAGADAEGSSDDRAA